MEARTRDELELIKEHAAQIPEMAQLWAEEALAPGSADDEDGVYSSTQQIASALLLVTDVLAMRLAWTGAHAMPVETTEG